MAAGPTARDVAERMLMGIAEKQTDPANPPGCLLVQGESPAAAAPKMSPSSSPPAAPRTKTSSASALFAPRPKVISSRGSDPAALARYVSAVSVGMGVMASSGSDREALRQVASVAVQAVEAQSADRT